MQIVELRVEGFARLKAVEIRPDGAIVPITGKNGQGKTSILRAIWALIEGRAAAPAVSIREGEEEATLYGDLGAYKITRTIRHDKEGREEWTLKVVGADGTRVTKKPQELIDSFKGDMGFDPLGWTRLPAKEQAKALRDLVKGFDFEVAADNRARAFAERTTANRKAKEAQAAADKVVLPAGKRPQAIDVAGKMAELEQARNYNADLSDRRTLTRRMREKAAALIANAAVLRTRAAALDTEVEEIAEQCDIRESADAKKPPIDTSTIQVAIGQAQQTDHIIAAFDRRQSFEEEAKSAQADSDRLTAEIEQIDAAQREAIASAKLPVKGLSLGDDAVLFNGLPLAQAGTAEKIEVALAIAMAKNPDLKVVLIDEGSELDSDAMEYVAGIAAKRGFQVWVARVDESRQIGFVIEDGRVASD